ncbi:hypothetical protein PO909_017384, partial [Leuciscus waleckii]
CCLCVYQGRQDSERIQKACHGHGRRGNAGKGGQRRSLLAFLGQVQLERLSSSAASEGSSGFSMVLDLGELLCHFPKEFGTMALSPLFIVFLPGRSGGSETHCRASYKRGLRNLNAGKLCNLLTNFVLCFDGEHNGKRCPFKSGRGTEGAVCLPTISALITAALAPGDTTPLTPNRTTFVPLSFSRSLSSSATSSPPHPTAAANLYSCAFDSASCRSPASASARL